MKRFLTVEDVFKELAVYPRQWLKYIRMESGEFRFVTIESGKQHVSMVEDGEKVVSGGQIKVKLTAFCFEDYGSYSCRVKWSNEDCELLAEALGLDEVEKYDF